MEKIKITKNEYNKISEKISREYIRKVLSLSKELSKEEREFQKKRIEFECDKELEKYEVIPFNPGVNNRIDNLINALCSTEIEQEGYKLFEGEIEDHKIIEDLIKNEGFEVLEDYGYKIDIYNKDLNVIIGRSFDDIAFLVCNSSDSFYYELKRLKELNEE